MSATVDFTTVSNAIAALLPTGVTAVKDVDEIQSAMGLDYAVLCPLPEGFITNLLVARDELSGQKLRVTYTLTYRYYHSKLGGDLFSTYGGMITNAAAILLAFSSDVTLAGAVDNEAPTFSTFGPVYDPAGNGYHGFDISINISQFLEV